MTDPVMMPDGADLVAVVVRGFGSDGAENCQGQDGNNQFFHRNARITRSFAGA